MKRACLFVVLAVLALLALVGCDNDTANVVEGPGNGLPVTDKTCLGCHSSQEELQLALSDTAKADFTRSNFSIFDKSDG
ncbi:hypothetical protein KDM41_02270 [bacterium]|nr:hypothetical protein [bacterium]